MSRIFSYLLLCALSFTTVSLATLLDRDIEAQTIKAKKSSFSYSSQILKDIRANGRPIAKLGCALTALSLFIAVSTTSFQQANSERIVALFSQTLSYVFSFVSGVGLLQYAKKLRAMKKKAEDGDIILVQRGMVIIDGCHIPISHAQAMGII